MYLNKKKNISEMWSLKHINTLTTEQKYTLVMNDGSH